MSEGATQTHGSLGLVKQVLGGEHVFGVVGARPRSGRGISVRQAGEPDWQPGVGHDRPVRVIVDEIMAERIGALRPEELHYVREVTPPVRSIPISQQRNGVVKGGAPIWLDNVKWSIV